MDSSNAEYLKQLEIAAKDVLNGNVIDIPENITTSDQFYNWINDLHEHKEVQ